MTYTELYKYSIDKLNLAGIEEADSDTRLLFSHVFKVDRGFLFVHGDEAVLADQEEEFLKMLSLREKRIPLQHITGIQNFMGLDFTVTKDVLIPRFDTECLVEEAMIYCHDGDKVLDVCTGSGCILISLMNYKNNIRGFGLDISEEALNIARLNAGKLCKQGSLELPCGDLNDFNDDLDYVNPKFIQSDLYTNLDEKDFDIIVSNPPYIRSDIIPTLMPEVRDYDPMLALDGGDDGLIFYRRIIGESGQYLKKGGVLLVEIGHDQGEEVYQIFSDNGFTDINVIKDLSGNDRVVRGKLKSL